MANLIGPVTEAMVEHGSRLDLIGASENATFEARHGSRIEAVRFSTKHARAAALDQCVAHVCDILHS